MDETFDFQTYMSNGVARVIAEAMRATLHNPRESLFLTRFAAAAKRAAAKRRAAAQQGEAAPAFLIAGITSSCNLHCVGCCSRATQACSDAAPVRQLTTAEWDDLFTQAEEMGVSFILLVGGEPLLRPDVIAAAAGHPQLLFPIFTNGCFVDDRYLELFDRYRNLTPIVSLEGDAARTDARRGAGVYRKARQTMAELQRRGLLYGVSITVTTENMRQVYAADFVDDLCLQGCQAIVYVEFVPMTDEAAALAPGDAERAWMQERMRELRAQRPDMVFVAFPGDEKSSGGCVAAGRGFFHINSHGDVEPCPFSPYSDLNVRQTPLKEALHSRLFVHLRQNGLLNDNHRGGCVLVGKKREVEAFLNCADAMAAAD